MSNRTDPEPRPAPVDSSPVRRSHHAKGNVGGLQYEGGIEISELDLGNGSSERDGSAAADERNASGKRADDERSTQQEIRAWESEGGATES